jgi:hypothetical protein
MALGDIAYQKFFTAGNLKGVAGTIEASSTATAFAILGTSGYIVSALIANQDDVDATVQVTKNSDDGTINSDHGSIWVDSSSSGVDTFSFHVLYV